MQFRLLVGLLFVYNFVFSQNYSYIGYSNAEGLPQSQVTDIVEDADGYLWVGTIGGLAKFNGIDFEVFSVNDGLINNRVSSLLATKNALYVGHDGGLTRKINNIFRTWKIEEGNLKSSVSSICEFDNKIWIATNGNGLFCLNNDKLERVKIDNEDALRIRDLEIFSNKLYLATRGGLYFLDETYKLNSVYSTKDLSLSSLKRFENKLYVSSFFGDVYALNQEGKIDHIILSSDLYSIQHLNIDSKGGLILSTDNGILWFDAQGKKMELNQKNGLPINVMRCSFFDSEGGLWLASEGKGLQKFAGTDFTTYTQSNGMPSDLILATKEIAPNTYWFGSYDQGAFLMKNDKVVKQLFPKIAVWSIYQDADNRIWFGTNSGLRMLDASGKLTIYDLKTGVPGEKITSFFGSGGNRFWVGGSEGISYFNEGKFKKIESPVSMQTVRQMSFYNNQIHVASDGGLFILDGKKLVLHPISITKSISSLVVDDDKLWIGTEEGLFYLQNNVLKQFKLGSDASSGFINFLQQSNFGIYVGTNNGLFSLKTDRNKVLKVRRYGVFQGLMFLESNLNSAYIDSKNNLWFGSSNGLIHFDAAATLNKPDLLAKIRLKSFLINYSKSKNEISYANVQKPKLALEYNKNTVSLYFDVLQLNDPSTTKIRYKLLGYTEDWSDWQSSKSIIFTKLPYGDYTLYVEAKSDFSIKIAKWDLNISVATPFYYRWWFILFCAVVLGLIIFQIIRSRLQKERLVLKQEMSETQARLLQLEQQSLNASMNRHFIFNALNSIQYFINAQDKRSANKYLTSFAKLIRKNLDSGNEKNSMVTLEEEMDRLSLYLSLESLRFSGKFEYEIIKNGLDLEDIRVPAMLLQPFVENSILHGILPRPEILGLIKIEINAFPEKIVITLTDNGVGIENSRKEKDQFEGDHVSQGMEITSKRIDLISKAMKEKYSLFGPLQFYNSDGSIGGTKVTIELPNHTD